MAQLADDFKVIDADTHYTEPYDLWTSRAPKGYENRVLHVEERDGLPTWVVDGNVLRLRPWRRRRRPRQLEDPVPRVPSSKGLDWVHEGAFDPQARLRLMDECGIHAQVLFPNVVGLGGTTLNNVIPDEALRMLCLEIYNDAMADLMTTSGNRFIPMTLMPAWNIDRCIQETKRAAALGLRGINMTSDPQDAGSPDLANRAWDPLWEVCSELNMPVHFHIGSSNTAMDFFGKYFWPSQDEYVKPAIGGGMLFLNSARVVMNTIFSGVFDRYPDLTMVAVESGIGWIPFILETMDYELAENAPGSLQGAQAQALRVLRPQLVRHVLVRGEPGPPAEPDGHGRRRSDHVRDRLPAPDLPVPVAGRECRRQDGDPAPRDAVPSHGRQRPQGLPTLTTTGRSWYVTGNVLLLGHAMDDAQMAQHTGRSLGVSMPNGDELHLLGVEIDTNFTRASDGRLQAERVPDPGAAPAPHLVVATAAQGRRVEFGTEVPIPTADAVRSLVADEPPVDQTSAALVHEANYLRLIIDTVGDVWIERVPCFIIDAVPEATCTRAIVDLVRIGGRRGSEPPSNRVGRRGPVGCGRGGRTRDSVCSTARSYELGVEAGTWTHSDHRGRGYAAAATAAWAALLVPGGRYCFYCTNDWNRVLPWCGRSSGPAVDRVVVEAQPRAGRLTAILTPFRLPAASRVTTVPDKEETPS